MTKKLTVSIGNAGEYFVAGELERRGFTVAVPMSNVEDFDILAINRETYEQFAIQVKTTGYKQKKWTLSKKNEELYRDNIIYVFVSLNELDTPEYHIVPSKVVADTIRKSHYTWLHTPGKKGEPHNDTAIRNFFDLEDRYLDRWDLIGLKRINDNEINKNIYYALTGYITKLEEIEYGKIYPEVQTGDGSMEKPFQMPHYVYVDVVNEFMQEVYKFEEEHPEYELNNYNGIMLREGIAWDEKAMQNVDICQLDGQTTMALIMGCVRAERFCDGALKDFLESGYIGKLLSHLNELTQ